MKGFTLMFHLHRWGLSHIHPIVEIEATKKTSIKNPILADDFFQNEGFSGSTPYTKWYYNSLLQSTHRGF